MGLVRAPQKLPSDAQLVLRSQNHVALFNPTSNEVVLHESRPALHGDAPIHTSLICPTCGRSWGEMRDVETAPHYFRLLAEAPITGTSTDTLSGATNAGYYARFFVELKRLGRGARGSVYLCQHPLGVYAVKKIPVGDHSETLLRSLREVHFMEELDHPNVVHYKHAWVEESQQSPFTPLVPTLHVLMNAANGGSLADWIDARLTEISTGQQHKRPPQHVEVVAIATDIARGLAFLHERGILHLDIKPGNVLLHWDNGAALPKAMLSDFGSSRLLGDTPSRRTGHTGTMEYMAPEAVLPDASGGLAELTNKADVWSLGIVFHMLAFLDIPYANADDIDVLRGEIASFRTSMIAERLQNSAIEPKLAHLLTWMLHVAPEQRPTCAQVLDVLTTAVSHPPMPTKPLLLMPTSLPWRNIVPAGILCYVQVRTS